MHCHALIVLSVLGQYWQSYHLRGICYLGELIYSSYSTNDGFGPSFFFKFRKFPLFNLFCCYSVEHWSGRGLCSLPSLEATGFGPSHSSQPDLPHHLHHRYTVHRYRSLHRQSTRDRCVIPVNWLWQISGNVYSCEYFPHFHTSLFFVCRLRCFDDFNRSACLSHLHRLEKQAAMRPQWIR